MLATLAGIVVLGGGAGYFLFSGQKKEMEPQAAAMDAHKEADKGASEPAVANLPQFVDLPEMTVNLVSASGKMQFLRVRVTLEIANTKTAQEIQPFMPRILDIFQVYLRELRVADIEGSAGVQRLKEELTKRVNQVASPAHIDAVLFKDMLVQ